jgi:hypothetical protein
MQTDDRDWLSLLRKCYKSRLQLNAALRVQCQAELQRGYRQCSRFGAFNFRNLGFIVCIFTFALMILSLPVMLYSYPPFIDLPNHLARHYIEAMEAGNSNHLQAGYLQQYYDFKWRPVPYQAADMLYVPLTRIMSIYNAGRIVIIIIIFLWLLTPMIVYRVIWGHYSAWPLFSALVVYNGNLTWGFEDYLLSAPFSILAFLLWTAWGRRASKAHFVLFTGIATALYFAHVMAFALLGLLVFSYEAGKLFQTTNIATGTAVKRLVLCGLPFSVGTMLFFLLILESQIRVGSRSVFGGLVDRLQVFSSPVMEFGSGATIAMSGISLVVLILILFSGCRLKGWLKLFSPMVPVLAVLAVVALLVPTISFGVYLTQIRIPVVLVVLLIGATHWEGVSSKVVWLFIAFIGVFLVTGSIVRAGSWRANEQEVKEIIAAFHRLNRGARLLVAASPDYKYPMYSQFASYAVIERQVYLPSLFTGPTNLRVTPAYRRIDVPQTTPVPVALLMFALKHAKSVDSTAIISGRYWQTWWRDFSDVLILGQSSDKNPAPMQLHVIYKGSFFVLYQNQCFDGGQNRKRAAAAEREPPQGDC